MCGRDTSDVMARTTVFFFIVAVIVIFAAPVCLTAPPSPKLLEQLKATGQLDKLASDMQSARERGWWPTGVKALDLSGSRGREFRLDPENPDTIHCIVILVDFTDNPASHGVAYGMPADFEHIMFSHNRQDDQYSLTEFYLDNSYGGFHITGNVVGWYRMPERYDFYVGDENGWAEYPNCAERLVEDALDAADPDVDFSLYDNDEDNWVDGLFVIHAGEGAEWTGSAGDIWSHMSVISNTEKDGVWLRYYSMEPEELDAYGHSGLSSIGVFAHEFGHILGLPDLYDYGYDSEGTGNWSQMSGGTWLNDGIKPAFFDPWCKRELGFLEFTNIEYSQGLVEIPAVQYNPVVYRLWEQGVEGPEYFLVENRRAEGNEAYLPGSGLLIYHVDENQYGNDDQWHYMVAVEQADGRYDLEYDVNRGDGGDPWGPGTQTEFNELTTPNTCSYDSVSTRTAIFNISQTDSVMYAGFEVDYFRPRWELLGGYFSDSAYGNDNDVIEEGESITFIFTLRNAWQSATNVTGSLTSDNSDITFDVPSINIGTVDGYGDYGSNVGSPLVFTIPPDFTACIDSFFLELTCDNPYQVDTFGFQLNIGPPKVLLVADDGAMLHEQSLINMLMNNRIPYDYHNGNAMPPPPEVMNSYPIVMWLTGDYRPGILSTVEINAIKTYLESGGNLFLNGQGIVGQLDLSDPGFLNNYLRATYDTTMVYPLMYGCEGSPIGDGIKIRYGATTNQTHPQTMGTINGSVANFDIIDDRVTALTYDGDYRLVLFSFGFEAISNSFQAIGYAPQDTVFNRIWEFFDIDTVSHNPTVTNIVIPAEVSLDRVLSHQPQFHWSTSDTTGGIILSYETCLGTGRLCHNRDDVWNPNVNYGPDTTVTYSGDGLLDGENYVFHVRVNNGITWSDWGSLDLHMNAVPSPGLAYEPAEGATVFTAGPELKMTNVVDPEGDTVTYYFELFYDSSLSVPVTASGEVAQGSPTTAWTVDLPLEEDHRYYWRGRVFDGYEYSDYTEVKSFWVSLINHDPAAFDLIVPADGDTVDTFHPHFVWSASSDIDPGDDIRYTLQVAEDSLFEVYQEVTDLPDTTFDYANMTLWHKWHWWRVKVSDTYADSAWSNQVFSFFSGQTGCCYLRGDIDHSGGPPIDIADLVWLIDYMFTGGPEPICWQEGDINADGAPQIDIADMVYLVDYMFTGGPPPPPC